MCIREAFDSDLDEVLSVERAAFGSDEEANLVKDLMEDKSARPTLSLLAFEDGHPEYYRRFGFRPAGKLGFDATYPILEKNADAWMLVELRPRAANAEGGKVLSADKLNKPEYWRE